MLFKIISNVFETIRIARYLMYITSPVGFYLTRRLCDGQHHGLEVLRCQDGLVDPQGLCQHRAGHYLAVVLHAQFQCPLYSDS